MDFMERLFFIFLVGVAIFIGLNNVTHYAKTMAMIAKNFQVVKERLESQKASIESLNNKINQIDSEFSLITNLSDEARRQLAVNRLAVEINENQDKLKKLSGLIENTPEKALSLTTLESKINNELIMLDAKVTLLQGQLDSARTYNLAFLAIIFGFVVFIAGQMWSRQPKKQVNKDA